MRLVIVLLLLLNPHVLLAKVLGTYYGQTLVKPLGYMSPRPPANVNHIDLADIRVQFSANQVCGYTDWSSAVIGLPLQILSGDYWHGVGDKIKAQAINSVLAISGAVPSMLMCTASPTFCAVLNRAEALAQANLKFTFDTCQVLEGLSDHTKAHFGPLASCIQKKVDEGKPQSQAIEMCSVGNHDPKTVSSKQKMEEAQRNAGGHYKSEDLTKRLCQERSHPRYRSSKHAYTITEHSCDWFSEFFPGISVEASAKFRHGGTFSNSPAEDTYDEHIGKTSHFLLTVLDTMHAIRYGLGPYKSQGPMPRHIVIVHPDVLKLFGQRPDGKIVGVCYKDDGSDCKNDISKLPPVYKFSSGSGLPALMVSPSTLYEMVELIPSSSTPSKEYKNEHKEGEGDSKEYTNRATQVALALEPLVRSLSYINTQDVMKDSVLRLRKVCKDPDFQSQAAQEDCQARLGSIEENMESLKQRSESDRQHHVAQMEYYREVEKIKAARLNLKDPPDRKGFSEFKSPQEVK